MSASSAQAWVGVAGALVAAILGVLKYFDYKSNRDRQAAIGAFFASTVEALASDNATRRMAAAVLLRRFFERGSEQGGRKPPYRRETVEVIAGMLRDHPPELLQKVLADGLRYAGAPDARTGWRRTPGVLVGADLQRCSLANAYLGKKQQDRRAIDLSYADLYEADCSGASFREVTAVSAVFYRCILNGSVFDGAQLEGANFREARLSGARFIGARIGGADFTGATDIPPEVARVLGPESVAPAGTVVER